jgi:serine protease
MGKSLIAIAALCGVVIGSMPSQAHAQAADAAIAGDSARVIVKFKADSALLSAKAVSAKAQLEANAESLGKRLGITMTSGAGVSERAQVVFAPAITSDALAQRLAQEPDVEYAVPDQRRRVRTAPNDPLYAGGVAGNGPAVGQWYLRAPSGEVQSSIDIETAWNVTMGSPSIVVADIDTGVRFEHPDLLAVSAGGNLLPGYDMISDVPTANDGDGRDADASDPGDWITAAEANNPRGPFYQCTEQDPNTGQYLAESSSWHGTQVAGLIVALTNNGVGMASVGPHLRLLPVRALGKCGGFDSDIIAGMRWAAGLSVPGVPVNPTPARVINMSLGGEGACTSAYQDAVTSVTATGTVIVVAAGNNAGHAVSTPGNCPGVIAVAGLRDVGTKVGFSSLGPEVALSSPAGNCVNVTAGSACLYPILTTSNSGITTPVTSIYTDSFNVSLGTSFATPLVAGTAGLMLSVQPGLTPSQIKQMLETTTRPFPATSGDATPDAPVPQCTAPQTDSSGNPIDQLECICTVLTCGAGMLDAGAAVMAANRLGTPRPVSDFNGDGKSDILWRQSSTGSVLMQTMNGVTVGSSSIIDSSSDWVVAEVGDFNGDGTSDILWRQSSTGQVIMELVHAQSAIAWDVINTSGDWAVAGVGDFNGDGKSDILWTQISTGTTILQIMNGSTVLSSTLVNANSDWAVVGVGDFDGDGKADILWRQASTGTVIMETMNGSSTLAANIVNTSPDWVVAGIGDFNGDGKSDILWRQLSTGAVIMQQMSGSTVLSSTLENLNIDWAIAGVGDFDGDGKSDILWRQISSGAVIMQLMDGAAVRSSTAINFNPDWSVSAPK